MELMCNTMQTMEKRFTWAENMLMKQAELPQDTTAEEASLHNTENKTVETEAADMRRARWLEAQASAAAAGTEDQDQ